jgi:hypothetical protein
VYRLDEVENGVAGLKVEGQRSLVRRQWLAVNRRSQTTAALTRETFDL